MNAYQMKIILKHSKPPVWRRCRIPAGITFSQLALILDDIVEAEKCPEYEYEFYQAGLHVREWREGERQTTSYGYDYLCAPDTFINGPAEGEAWFTFRPGDGRQYRIEIEKRLPEGIPCPVIVKESRADLPECFRRDAEEVNRELERRYTIRYGEPDHRMFAELKADVEAGGGLSGALHPKDKTDRNESSARTKLRTVADRILQQYSGEMQEKMEAEEKRREDGGDVDPDAFQDIFEDVAWKAQQEIKTQIFGYNVHEEESRDPEIKACLLEETKNTLLEIAEDLQLTNCRSLNKDALAERIRDELLKPGIMARRMLLLSDDEIREFEKAIEKENGYYPGRKELENLEKLYHLLYVMIYRDDYVQVPRETAEIYRKINTPEFQEERRGTYWLYHCLMMTEFLYACAPVSVVCRMMEKCLGHKVEQKELEELWKNIPDELNPCVQQDGRVILKEVLEDQLYLSIEKTQGEKTFYIPDPEEIIEYTEKGYPASDPYYRRLKVFLLSEMGMRLNDAEEYLPVVWRQISMGGTLPDILELLKAEEISFPSDKALEEFCAIMTDVNNHTRMVVNRGQTPIEICHADEITTVSMPDGISGKTVVGKRKIYPNDPCPCGSGKKYKKCCGKKQ